MLSGPIVWCAKCGCYSRDRVVNLARDCVPKTVQQNRALRDLRGGRAPGDPVSVGQRFVPVRLTLAQWVLKAAPDLLGSDGDIEAAKLAAELERQKVELATIRGQR